MLKEDHATGTSLDSGPFDSGITFAFDWPFF